MAAAWREEGLGPRAQSDLCVEACRARRLLSRRGRLESPNLDSEARGDVNRAAVAGHPLGKNSPTSKLEHPLENY